MIDVVPVVSSSPRSWPRSAWPDPSHPAAGPTVTGPGVWGSGLTTVTVLIGTSGWQYRDWRGLFYPERMASRQWLEHYAGRFATVEINNSFYRLPDRETFARWQEALPEDFVVAVKASRYLTHVKRLQDPREPVRRLMEAAKGLGSRLGPILLQLPPTLRADPDRLDATLKSFPSGTRVAVEVRHPSWFEGDAAGPVRAVLEAHDAAWVLADGGAVTPPDWVTASWSYVRFHAGTGRPPSCYRPSQLDRWADRLHVRCGTERDVYCYFNNDRYGCAVRDAQRFAAALRKAGLDPTRVPTARETPVRH
jgi:uncharacterized protein YecE (DUF72 family)